MRGDLGGMFYSIFFFLVLRLEADMLMVVGNNPAVSHIGKPWTMPSTTSWEATPDD